MKYYTYVLMSLKDKMLYIGFTTDLRVRLIAHATGQVRATKDRLPLKLIHYEYFIEEEDAKKKRSFSKKWFWQESIKESS